MSKPRLKILLCLCISMILLSLCFSSCSLEGSKAIFNNDEQKADKRMEELVETLKNKDKDALKAMFSKQAFDESHDFESSMEYLFDFFGENVTSWNRDRFSGSTSSDYGKESVMLRSWYTVTIDQDTYLFFVIDYIKDTINPDNEGLYTLRVIKKEEESSQFESWQKMQIAGIYVPEE
ncbi:hypothetical protein FACS1894111_01150 [Clostridia bacterium]|nr:hypothetical protein FACS1894111_01150 [Clostridia bacterium]